MLLPKFNADLITAAKFLFTDEYEVRTYSGRLIATRVVQVRGMMNGNFGKCACEVVRVPMSLRQVACLSTNLVSRELLSYRILKQACLFSYAALMNNS